MKQMQIILVFIYLSTFTPSYPSTYEKVSFKEIPTCVIPNGMPSQGPATPIHLAKNGDIPSWTGCKNIKQHLVSGSIIFATTTDNKILTTNTDANNFILRDISTEGGEIIIHSCLTPANKMLVLTQRTVDAAILARYVTAKGTISNATTLSIPPARAINIFEQGKNQLCLWNSCYTQENFSVFFSFSDEQEQPSFLKLGSINIPQNTTLLYCDGSEVAVVVKSQKTPIVAKIPAALSKKLNKLTPLSYQTEDVSFFSSCKQFLTPRTILLGLMGTVFMSIVIPVLTKSPLFTFKTIPQVQPILPATPFNVQLLPKSVAQNLSTAVTNKLQR